MSSESIILRGVEVHNLKQVDLDLPRRKLIVICGLSGSGKTSLAIDTLYAEGQRRYIESFSAYTRQFLERLEKPDAERIDGIPAAVAVTRKQVTQSSRSTVATATEIADYLRLLFAKLGEVQCIKCGRLVERDSPQRIIAGLAPGGAYGLADGGRFVIAYAYDVAPEATAEETAAALREEGFLRILNAGRMLRLTNGDDAALDLDHPVYVLVDRLTAGQTTAQRLGDSLETAFKLGHGRLKVFVEQPAEQAAADATSIEIDGQPWGVFSFSTQFRCDDCGIDYATPEPRLFSFNSPLGACPECEGFGNVIDVDMELVVPDASKSIRAGAIAPWNTPAYAHELEELLALADDYHLPVDVPFSELNDEQIRLIQEGVPERNFGGLHGFFAWLTRRKYKMHLRVFLSRWRSSRPCPKCGGARLREESLAAQIGGKNIAEVCAMRIDRCAAFFDELPLAEHHEPIAKHLCHEIRSRLRYLHEVGLSYLSLDRTLKTLSSGEAQRVALTSALGSSMVNMLYVLDEPSVGLHPRDVRQLVEAIERLRSRGNTVVVVEHEEAMIRAADQVVEVGPGAGEQGGEIVFQGTPAEMEASPTSLTGDYLSGRRLTNCPARRRDTEHGWIKLSGARGNNLKNISIEFPLGVLCVVTGVSGAGKSTLVQDTLYPGLSRRMGKDAPKPLPYDDLYGDGQIDDVVLVDQSPIGRSPRSNPVTYLKAFDEIRSVFASSSEARMRNLTPGHFSFNVDGGRCTHCNGDGSISIDMQFLADIYMKCPQCQGRRYRPEILEVRYRGRNIADVLDLTVRQAFTFFRGRPKVQSKLKRLIDVGLDYLRLGQPANTLSGGEAQRLKLAAYVSGSRRGRTLFVLDEPTTGLHFSDVVQLLDCFDALLAVGHSLIVVEHNLQVMKMADHIIDLGPGAGDDGGEIVCEGPPETIVRCESSVTGRYLAGELSSAPQVEAEFTDDTFEESEHFS
ncbi:MAG: excinuclease ABC subunit UvrA [Pirellulales bacterium]